MGHEITDNPLAAVEAHSGPSHYRVRGHGAHIQTRQPNSPKPAPWMSDISLFQDGHFISGGFPFIFPRSGRRRKTFRSPCMVSCVGIPETAATLTAPSMPKADGPVIDHISPPTLLEIYLRKVGNHFRLNSFHLVTMGDVEDTFFVVRDMLVPEREERC